MTLQTRDWSEQSASTSLMSYGDGRQTDLILYNGPFWPRKIGHSFPCISSFLRFWGY